jgi:hypothetical protein
LMPVWAQFYGSTSESRFKASRLTREAYSKRKRIQVYQLDCWRKKLSRMSKTATILPRNQWVPLKIADGPTEKDSQIDLWIGQVRIEIKKEFDAKLPAEIIRTVDGIC